MSLLIGPSACFADTVAVIPIKDGNSRVYMGGKMVDKNIEMMKKLIEAKKQKSSEQGWVAQYDKKMGKRRTPGRKIKKGGLFDK